ncbi:MAG: flagellar hook capping FlgD N-terminal domain-containing protein [Butyricicoccus sp.]|nr:flagellar hook capping FlgD N-terminal domain-containing protein [Butyricicoccus sp.]
MSDLFTPTVARMSSPVMGAASTNTTNTTTGTKKTDNSDYVQDSNSDNLSLTMEDFLQLMVVQFQNQDIENPASTSDMMNQLISMSTIQAMATMTDAATMSYAASLIGKTVTIGQYEAGSLKEIVGEVTGSATYDGEQVIFVNGKQYYLNEIMAVGTLPAEETTETPESGDSTTDTSGTEGGDRG